MTDPQPCKWLQSRCESVAPVYIFSILLVCLTAALASPGHCEDTKQPQEMVLFVSKLITRPRFLDQEPWTFRGMTASANAVAGDFNCDGIADLALPQSSGTSMLVGLSGGRGSFQGELYAISGEPYGTPISRIVVADLDNDGCMNDVVMVSENRPATLIVLRQTGERSFTAYHTKTGIGAAQSLVTIPFRGVPHGILITGPRSARHVNSAATILLEPLFRGAEPSRERGESAMGVESVGFADFLGDPYEFGMAQRRDFLQQNTNESIPSIQWFGETIVMLPQNSRWRSTVIGEFNGDGRDDFLTLSEDLSGSMLVVSNGTYPFEISLPLLPKLLSDPIVGDFDGDGLSDLAQPQENGLLIQRSAPSTPVAGAAASFKGTSFGPEMTDASGRLHLPPYARVELSVTVSSPIGRQVGLTRRYGSRLFAGILDPKDIDSGAGAPVSYDGVQRSPTVCNGFVGAQRWSRWGRIQKVCPPHYAVLESDDNRVGDMSLCCRLPREDILTGEEQVVDGFQCPDDFIAAGPPSKSLEGFPKLLCRKINRDRYVLETPQPARYWGIGGSAPLGGRFIQRSQIPPALRVGVGRSAYLYWDSDGCIGHEDNAVFVSRGVNRCFDARTSRIYEKVGKDEHGADKLALLELFPRCQSVPDPFDPTKGCIEQPGSTPSDSGQPDGAGSKKAPFEEFAP